VKEKIIDKFEINLNQNLWILVVSLSGLGLSEYFELKKLITISYILSIVSSISIFFTLLFYTIDYCKKKLKTH